MSREEQDRPRSGWTAGDRNEKLFLLSGIAGGQEIARLEDRDLNALRSVANWVRTFIIQPNQELGRSGPICPFTPVALEHDALWLALEHTGGTSMPDMIERIKVYSQRLLANAPVD